MIVLVSGAEVNADSRKTALADRDALPLTPRKQERSRVLHEVLSRQKFRVFDRRRIHQRRDAVLHTDLTGDSTDADCTMRSVASTSQEGYDESPRRADPDESATSASRTQQQQQQQQQCSVSFMLMG